MILFIINEIIIIIIIIKLIKKKKKLGVYKSKNKAQRQARAIYASGYKGKK